MLVVDHRWALAETIKLPLVVRMLGLPLIAHSILPVRYRITLGWLH